MYHSVVHVLSNIHDSCVSSKCLSVCCREWWDGFWVGQSKNIQAFASVSVLTIMMMVWLRKTAVFTSGSFISYFLGRRRRWWSFSCIYGCCGYIYYFVKRRNVVLGWPLSKENNGSSNVQLTVSISVLYPVIMPSKVCSLLIWAFLLLWITDDFNA